MLKKFLPTARALATKSTVDPNQIKPFNELSKIWWDTNGNVKLLHAMNSLRIPWIQNRLSEIGAIKTKMNAKSPLKGLTILDVGCGGGIMAEPLSRLGGKIVGLDCNTEMLNIAESRANHKNLGNLKYLYSTVEEHVMDNRGKYDVVVASETIEHVTEQNLFVKSCVECLKPGGSFFVTTNSKSIISKFISITLTENILRRSPKGTHEYDMFIDVENLKRMLQKENCETVFTSGVIYNPLNNKWVMIKNHHILHYILHAVKM